MHSYLLILVFLLSLIKADQIIILEPSNSAVYHANDNMDISYNIRSMGMTRIWSALATLTQTNNNQTIEGFPTLSYDANNSKKEVSGAWTIPDSISNGTYSLAIAANVTYLCSKSNNGKAPFKQCKEVVYQKSTFVILNTH